MCKKRYPTDRWPFFSIPTELLVIISKEIEKLFPGESASTYFSSYRSENGISIPPSGSLWFNYNYVKDVLRSNNLLEVPKKQNSKETSCISTEGSTGKYY